MTPKIEYCTGRKVNGKLSSKNLLLQTSKKLSGELFKITKKKLKDFREDFDIAMIELGAKHDLGIKLGKISYSGDSIKATLSGISVTEGMSGEQAEFNKRCYKYCMNPEDYKKEVVYAGSRLQIIGFELKRRKYPILVNNLDKEKKEVYTRDIVSSLR